jgi:ribosomal protein S28E/S33
MATVIVLLLMAACSKGDSGRGPEAASGGKSDGAAANALPEVRSASLYPEKPTAKTPISANYDGRDPEGGQITYAFRWYVDNELVQEGPQGSLQPGKHRRGSEVYAEVIPSNAHGTGRAYRTPAVMVGNLPPEVQAVALTPADPKRGEKITATATGADPDGEDVELLYQWRVNEKVLGDPGKVNTLETRNLKKKDMVYVVVYPVDREVRGPLKASDVIVIANTGPEISSVPVTSLQNGMYTYQVAAKDPDNDKLTYRLEQAPAGMTISPSGLIQWQPPKQVEGRQDIPVKIVVDDGDGGSVTQEFSLTLEMK